uniref:Reverse transcriptase domain-containing protein n=1 Tax=Ulva compressa TaxID=63659 RepID=A0A678ZD18_ULVCO|nr:hypothetical protein [Ulva compressa]
MEMKELQWNQIQWKNAETRVRKLQEKIFLHSKKGNLNKVHLYQKFLTQSRSARLLAVRKVTQDNRGKNTAGIDGVKSIAPGSRLALSRAKDLDLNGKADKIRRVYIPKAGTKERRPLGIPTMRDRAKQALAKLALEPEWEALFEPNSYGFRPGRGCHDAVEAILRGISQSREGKFVLDADIKKCFDRIDHAALIKRLRTWPQLEVQIHAWLKAGILDGGALSHPGMGTPQGGVISPLLCNIALHGIEKHLSQWISEIKLKDSKGRSLSRRDKVASLTIVRYADDLVILHKYQWVVESAREILNLWLSELGLELNPEKTRIGHTTNPIEGTVGFDFLGFNVRKYSVKVNHRGKLHLPEKTFIKPSKQSIKDHVDDIRTELRKCVTAEAVVAKLTPIIRGWCNYYSTVVSKEVFSKLRYILFNQLVLWAQRKRPTRGSNWIRAHYWQRGKTQLEFGHTKSGKWLGLKPHNTYGIKRHVKVKGDKSVYDGDTSYWAQRLRKLPGVSTRVSKLLKTQKGKCGLCKLNFCPGDIMEVDHVVPLSRGGKDDYTNVQLLHGHCHDQKTAAERTVGEEPLALRGARAVLK